MGGNLKLVMRKASWDPQIDEELMSHAATLNLLYVQTVAEVERGWVRADPETKRQLARMQARGAKKEVRILTLYVLLGGRFMMIMDLW